jgi:glucose/mannose transport system permease protein
MTSASVSSPPFTTTGPRPKRRITAGRIGVYAFLIGAAAFFALPLVVMILTSLKTMDDIRSGSIFSLPSSLYLGAWVKAWSSACTGVTCAGIQVGFWNSVQILLPSVAISVLLGSLNGYALALWNVRWAGLAFALLMTGTFVPHQVYIFPLVQMFAFSGTFGTLAAIVLVHVIFGMPIMTLIFRNYFVSIPPEIFKAARMDGAGFWRIFLSIVLPMSTPVMVVAVIWQVTGIWNDFLLGLIFAGRENLPMTVQLNNIVNAQFGEREYNVDMAATMLTALVPLALYFLSGRWFVRGIAAGSVKG